MIPIHINNSKPVSFLVDHRCIIMPSHQVMSNVTANRVLLKKKIEKQELAIQTTSCSIANA